MKDKNAPTAEPRLPRALFSTGFDTIATLWHKNPKAPDALLPEVKKAMVVEGLRVSEALTLSDKVSFKVYGENVVLCRLIDTYGVKGVEQLLEDGAIEFVLWRDEVVKLEKPIPGVYPLAPLTLTTPAHSDPQASVELGLKGWSNKPLSEVKRLSKLAVDKTILPAQQLHARAIQAVFAAYNNGLLEPDGFDSSVPIDSIGPELRNKLARLGSNVHEGMLLLESEYDLHEGSETWDALVKVASRFTTENGITETAESVLALEGLPSIPDLIRKRVITWEDVVGVRGHPATQEFRRWLWSQPDPMNSAEVARAYAAAITHKKLVDRDWFKAAKILGMNVAQTVGGAALGAAAAGLPGTILGGVAGFGMSMAEVFYIDKLLRGMSPRRFAEEVIRPRVAEKATGGTSGENQ